MLFDKIHLRTPDWSLFTLPPRNDPLTIPPPLARSSLNAPAFTILEHIYQAALDVKVPVTIALLYLVTVTAVNAYNRNNGNKPWAISKTRAFFAFVIIHNIFLAVYSGWTFLAMWGALARTLQSPTGPAGVVGFVDSLCKMHGPSGLAQAVTYNPNAAQWISQSPETVRLAAGAPDRTDLGRLWNEGLAFYGWIFYLSKFYEVIDTAIILAKGKRSPTLQTYHHAGAMMCMWSGIRFMSPPIWMFVFVNSAIHTMMYTYYTLAALSIRVPTPIKRSLTTMQIIQFLVGASYASLHSFVSYEIPTRVADPIQSIKESIPSITSAVAQAISTGLANGGLAASVKKLLFRAAGGEGVAENVGAYPPATTQHTHVANPHPRHILPQTYHTEYHTINCIDTSGQTFGIWLNVFYLTPLTFLFMRFFYKAYIRRTSKSAQATREVKAIKANGNGKATNHKGEMINETSQAARDALKGIDKELNGTSGNLPSLTGSPIVHKNHGKKHR